LGCGEKNSGVRALEKFKVRCSMLVLKSVRAVEKFNVNGWLHKGSEQFKQYNHGCVKYAGSELSTVTIALN